MYRECYSDTKVTFSKLRHKRLRLHISDAEENVVPYVIYPVGMGERKILKGKRLTAAMQLCTGSLESVADKLRYARLSAGLHQDALANMVGMSRSALLRYENGQVAEEYMEIGWLMDIALACGVDKHFCCNPYHMFILQDAGAQVKQYRLAVGLTQKRLAERLGVNVSTVKGWEWGKNKPPLRVWELVSSLLND